MTALLRALIVLLAFAGHAQARCEGVVPGQRPQNTAREFVGATLDEIVARGFIEIAVHEDFPPYSCDAAGKPQGVDVDVGRIIAAGLGVEARFRFVQAGEVMAVMGPLSQLEHGAGDGVRVHTPPLPGFALGTWTLGLAVHHSHRDLGYAVDDAVAAALADGRIAAAYKAHGLDFTPPVR